MISAVCVSPELLNLEEIIPWTEITRPDYDRRGLRYAGDASDAEWVLVGPFLEPRSNFGRPREVDMRDVWDAIQYVAAGCPWRLLPTDFPPVSTVQYHFYRLRDFGVLDLINEALVTAARVIKGREAEPAAGVIDSQSVKTTEVCGYDAGKKVKGESGISPLIRGAICCSARGIAPSS